VFFVRKVYALFLVVLFFLVSPVIAWAAPFSGGDGTPENPYIITTPEELDAVRDAPSAHYRLNNDIDLTDYLAPGGAGCAKWGSSGWQPIGAFTGGFDGDGYIISGLWIDRSGEPIVGLFGYINNAAIKNLGVEIARAGVKGNGWVGGLVGVQNDGSIENSYVTGEVSGEEWHVGGLVGFQNGSIANSYATGNVSGYISVGGLVGGSSGSIENSYAASNANGEGSVGGLIGIQTGGGSILNSYATGDVSSNDSGAGGLVGRSDGSSITNSYATGDVSGSGEVGSLVGIQWDGSITNSYRYVNMKVNDIVLSPDDPESASDKRHGGVKTAVELMTKDTYTGNGWLFNDSTPTGPWYWDDTDNTRSFPKLNIGTEKFPFRFPIVITTPEQLDEVRDNLSAHYMLGNDIDLTDYLAPGGAGYAKWAASGWQPIGDSSQYFTGSFDGNGYKITGLWIDRSNEDYVGLFGNIYTATIKNLGVEITAAGVNGHQFVGGLVGFQENSNIINSYATGNISGNYDVGGLVGLQNFGSIETSYAMGDVSGNEGVGGLVSNQNNSSITNSYTIGNASGTSYVGGLVGLQQANSSITNSYATGDVRGDKHYVGGLVGLQRDSSSIINSYSTNDVSGDSAVGGLVGYQLGSSSITNSYVTGDVSGYWHVGGLAGAQDNSSSIEDCYATGDVRGGNRVGGLVGFQWDGSITNCYATGDVRGGNRVGSLVGWQGNSNITNSYSTSDVSGDSAVGGLVGYQEGDSTITNSYRYAGVTVTDSNGPVPMDENENGIHGGVKTAVEFMTKDTYTGNGWLFIDSEPTAGPWHWGSSDDDSSDDREFPKLNIGTESFPFRFPIVITTPEQLDAVRDNLSAHYMLGNDIDLTDYLAPGGAGYAKWDIWGWLPIGDNSTNDDSSSFTGSFDGNGHKITGL